MAAFSEFTIYSVTSLAAMVAMCQMRRLEYVRSEVSSPLIGHLYLISSEPGVGQPPAHHRPDRCLHLRRVLHHRDPVPAGVSPG